MHVGINGILRSKSENDLKESTNNIINMNNKLKQLCQENNFAFIDNFQITSNDLWKDGFYLVEENKVLLASSLINNLFYFLPSTQV